MKYSLDAIYVKSGKWKCHNAPINLDIPLQVEENCGAHHWVERWLGEKLDKRFVCKYCYDVRRFPVSFHYNILGYS